jgi:hypothetical protein
MLRVDSRFEDQRWLVPTTIPQHRSMSLDGCIARRRESRLFWPSTTEQAELELTIMSVTDGVFRVN